MLLHLLEAALRSFVLGGAVWLGLKCLRVQSPQTRMTTWTVVLMASLAMPVVMHWARVSVAIHSPTPVDAAVVPASLATPGLAPPTLLAPEQARLPDAAENVGTAAQPAASGGASPLAAIVAVDWQAVAIGLYFAVAGALLVRLMIGLALTWRLLRSGTRLDADWALGLNVRLSATVVTPVTFASTILLPAECLDWSPMKRQAVLAHERSHMARRDFHVLLLATVHRAVFWFSPFSWWLLNELAETAELVSDDAAIATLGDRPCYAEILLDVAQSARPIAAGIGMARTRSAVTRVDHILAATAPPPPRPGWGKWAAILVSLAPPIAIATVSFSSLLPGEAAFVKVTLSGSAGQRGIQSSQNSVVPELWISRNASADPHADSGDPFNPDADWKTVAGRSGALQFPPGVILNAKAEDLQRAFRNLAERHIGLALEFRVLVRSEQCPQMTKGFSDPGELQRILERIHKLGGNLKYVVMDDPYYFGHRFVGQGACLEPPAKLAQQIDEKIQLVRRYFPKAQIGTAEVVDESTLWIDELVEWIDVYRRVTGEPLAFFHADVAWSQTAIRNLVPLGSALKARHIPFGIIYNADDAAHSDEAWADSTRRHIAEIESTLGIHPYAAIFRSWSANPSRLLPETQASTLTGVAAQYLLPRPSITFKREANRLSGRVVDAQGLPVASESLSVEALDVAGGMDPVERQLAAKVPTDAATAMAAYRSIWQEPVRARVGSMLPLAPLAITRQALVGTRRSLLFLPHPRMLPHRSG